MDIIMFLIIGLVSGWVASSLVKGQGSGLLFDVVIGVIGAFVGGFIFRFFGLTTYGLYGSLVTSIVGAIVFLALVRLFSKSNQQKNLNA